MTRTRRILVYSHDTYGLGNIRRMLSIAEHLLATHDDLSILMASGSPMLHAFRVSPGLDYIKLPCLTRTVDGDYAVKSLGISIEATMHMRSQLLRAAMLDFEPDLVIVDKKPFGVDDELAPALADARRSARPPKLVLLLRDILDDPATTSSIWRKNGYFEAIEKYYDQVLVLGTPEVFDLPSEYNFPPVAADRVAFCGYVGRPPGRRSRSAIREELNIADNVDVVLLTPGGGEDGAELIDCFIRGSLTGSTRTFHTIIVSGPETPPEAKAHLSDAVVANADVSLLDFTDDMMSYVGAADLVVCMGGYNTVCEFLSAGRRAVVIPRTQPVQEQLIRARLMAAQGLFETIHPDELTAVRLAEAVRSGLSKTSNEPGGGELDMGGLGQVEKHVCSLLGDNRPSTSERLVDD